MRLSEGVTKNPPTFYLCKSLLNKVKRGTKNTCVNETDKTQINLCSALIL